MLEIVLIQQLQEVSPIRISVWTKVVTSRFSF